MKKLVISIVFVFVGFTVFGQQDAQFTQNVFNKLDINPGYAGATKGKICFTMLGRQQWSGFDGNPETYLFSGNARFNQHGVGLTIFSDKLGIESSLFAKGAYSYNIPLKGGVGNLGIGAEVGMLNKSLGSDFIAVQNPDDDPAIPNENTAVTTFDAGFGLYLQMPKFYVGLSAQHIPASTLKDVANGDTGVGVLNYDIARHYYMMVGYNWDIQQNQRWILKPSVFVKTDAASTQMDFNVLIERNLEGNKMLWGGVSYRLEDAVAVLLGMKVSNFNLGVSYDITTSSLGDHSNGSMEFMLKYCFNLTKPPVRIKYTDPGRLQM